MERGGIDAWHRDRRSVGAGRRPEASLTRKFGSQEHIMRKTRPPLRAEDLPYRPCVGVMILNRDGLVWAGRRIPVGNSEYDGSSQLWQMPQGGIDKGEDPLDAAYRELYEETGMKTVSLLAEAKEWINYDLPPELIR